LLIVNPRPDANVSFYYYMHGNDLTGNGQPGNIVFSVSVDNSSSWQTIKTISGLIYLVIKKKRESHRISSFRPTTNQRHSALGLLRGDFRSVLPRWRCSYFGKSHRSTVPILVCYLTYADEFLTINVALPLRGPE